MKKLLIMFSILLMVLLGGVSVYADDSVQMTELAEYALSWDGNTNIPYVYGGSGRSMGSLEEVAAAGAGLDCSGFVALVYRHFNINIPMQSSAIKNAAVEVFTDESQAVPGDVVWWSGHVGIYVGNGKIVHTNTKNPPTNFPHVSQISGEGANYRFPQAFCRMVSNVDDLRPITETEEVEEVVQEVEETTPYGSIITESDLTGLVMEDFLRAEQKRLTMVNRDLLTTAEIKNLDVINSYFKNQENVLTWYQKLQSFLGICSIFYGVLLIVAYILDYSNVFIEFSVISILTFGKFKILDAKELVGVDKRYYTGWRRDKQFTYLTPAMLAARVAVLFVLGIILISGFIGDSIISIVMLAKEALGLV